MTRLRPRLASDAQAYPERSIVYRRPFLRLLAGVFLALISEVNLATTFVELDDGFGRGEWLLPLAFLPTLGFLYLFLTSTLVVDRTHVVISNPLRRARVPLAHVTDVVLGSHLKIVTPYKSFWAWGVEAANVQLARGDLGSQETLQAVISGAAATAKNDNEAHARYRLRPPDVVFTAYLMVTLVCSFALLLGYGTTS